MQKYEAQPSTGVFRNKKDYYAMVLLQKQKKQEEAWSIRIILETSFADCLLGDILTKARKRKDEEEDIY